MDNQETQVADKIREKDVADRVAEVMGRINSLDKTKVQCTMGIVVMKPEEGTEMNGVHVYAIGDNEEIVKMVVQLIESSRSGIQAANAEAEEAEEAEVVEEINHSGVVH